MRTTMPPQPTRPKNSAIPARAAPATRPATQLKKGDLPLHSFKNMSIWPSETGALRNGELEAVRTRSTPIRAGLPSALPAASPTRGFGAAPVQLMPTWKRRFQQALKWGGGALALGGAAAALAVPGAALAGVGMMIGGGMAYMGGRAMDEQAETRRDRWRKRAESRKSEQRFPTGRYVHNAGPVGVSGIHRQRISQTNRADWGTTFGSMPAYSRVEDNLDYPGAHRTIHDPDFEPPVGLTAQQRMATALAASLSNVSEEDKAPGMSKLIRALSRRHTRDGNLEHPLDPDVNPAVMSGGAARARALMRGDTPLSPSQRDAIDNDASNSSDEEDDHFVGRTGMLRRRF